MSLIPIIYASLLIFSGLTVIVILFSFISYKIRGEKNETHSLSGAGVKFSMQPAYQTSGSAQNSNFVNTIAKRNQIRSSYERRRAEIRLNYLNDLQRTRQNYVSRKVEQPEERVSDARANRRFEVVTTFERENDILQTAAYERRRYNYTDNSFMNYYSNESDVYFPPKTGS